MNVFPKQIYLVNRNFYKCDGGHLRSQSDLRDFISTPKDGHFYGLSLEYFGFSLTAFPLCLYYDLLTQIIEFRAAAMLVHVGANSLKKTHHIVILQFSEVVKCHANRIELVKKCDLFRQVYFFEESYGENSDMV